MRKQKMLHKLVLNKIVPQFKKGKKNDTQANLIKKQKLKQN